MKVVAISGAVIGKKTLTAMKYVAEKMNKDFPEVEFDLIDLGEKDIQFSDGRNYTEYQGDTLEVTTKIMEADALIIETTLSRKAFSGSKSKIFFTDPGIEAWKIGVPIIRASASIILAVTSKVSP